MEQAELLAEFRANIDEFVRYQEFIDKATGQADRFAAAVIQKVVEKNEAKKIEVVEALVPLTADVEQAVEALKVERATVLEGQESSRLELEELELMQVIGELTKKQFDSKAKNLKKILEEVDEKVKSLDETMGTLQAELDRWREASGVPASSDDEEVEIVAADDVEEILEAVDVSEGGDEGVHADSVSVKEDVSAVFEDDGDDLIEAAEAGDEEIDILADDDDGLELEAAEIEAEEGDDASSRRAVLLYLEGTADEQVYPITNEVISLGRGRDNDIQVKNDSKVSRYLPETFYCA